MKKSLWEINGYKLKPLFIEADSFDEAIKQAREIDNDYSCGRCLILRGKANGKQ